MKTFSRYLPTALIMLLLPAISWGQATAFTLDPSSTIVVKGTSTIHDWEADVEEMDISIVLDSDELKKGSSAGSAVESFALSVPVESMESGKRKMNKKMYEALKKDDYPDITFNLQSAEFAAGSDSKLNVRGDLMVAGMTKTISLPVNVTQVNVGSYLFEGSHSLNMKDYDVDPPSAMLGAIRSGEEVEIVFNIIVKEG
ncbi:MAG TPA: YceI family protein [Fodinibius sp.]|nr:YceI family protein [Fodinibius sp.]